MTKGRRGEERGKRGGREGGRKRRVNRGRSSSFRFVRYAPFSLLFECKIGVIFVRFFLVKTLKLLKVRDGLIRAATNKVTIQSKVLSQNI